MPARGVQMAPPRKTRTITRFVLAALPPPSSPRLVRARLNVDQFDTLLVLPLVGRGVLRLQQQRSGNDAEDVLPPIAAGFEDLAAVGPTQGNLLYGGQRTSIVVRVPSRREPDAPSS